MNIRAFCIHVCVHFVLVLLSCAGAGAAEPAAEPAAEVAEEAVPWLGVYLGMPVKALRAARPQAERLPPFVVDVLFPPEDRKPAGERPELFAELPKEHRVFSCIHYHVEDGKLVLLSASMIVSNKGDGAAMMRLPPPEDIIRRYRKKREAFYQWLSEFRGKPTDRAIVKVRREFEYMAPLFLWKGKKVTVAATAMPDFSEIVPNVHRAWVIMFLNEETQLPSWFAPITLDAESERDVYRRAAIPPALEKRAEPRE